MRCARRVRCARRTVTVNGRRRRDGPPVRTHHFRFGTHLETAILGEGEFVKVVALAETGELVPATSLCQLVQQAAAEQLEVYRESSAAASACRGTCRWTRPTRWRSALFTGIDKGMRKWEAYRVEQV